MKKNPNHEVSWGSAQHFVIKNLREGRKESAGINKFTHGSLRRLGTFEEAGDTVGRILLLVAYSPVSYWRLEM